MLRRLKEWWYTIMYGSRYNPDFHLTHEEYSAIMKDVEEKLMEGLL